MSRFRMSGIAEEEEEPEEINMDQIDNAKVWKFFT